MPLPLSHLRLYTRTSLQAQAHSGPDTRTFGMRSLAGQILDLTRLSAIVGSATVVVTSLPSSDVACPQAGASGNRGTTLWLAIYNIATLCYKLSNLSLGRTQSVGFEQNRRKKTEKRLEQGKKQ